MNFNIHCNNYWNVLLRGGGTAANANTVNDNSISITVITVNTKKLPVILFWYYLIICSGVSMLRKQQTRLF